MTIDTQETKIENLRIKATAKAKVEQVVEAIRTDRNGFKPTLTEALVIMADHYLATAKPA